MNRFSRWLIERMSRLLDSDERDAVRGDLQESGATIGQTMWQLTGLVARRYGAPWTNWEPWAAPLGLLAPLMLLMGGRRVGQPWLAEVSRQAATLWKYQARYQVGLPLFDDVVHTVCVCLLTVMWAWAGGFAFGLWARRLSWIHPALVSFLLWFCGFPVLLALTRPDMVKAGEISVVQFVMWMMPAAVFFLAPLVAGVFSGSRSTSVSWRRVLLMGVGLTLLTIVEQIGAGRGAMAYDLWAAGQDMDARVRWDPQPLPFAAILWQLVFMTATARWQRRHVVKA